MAVTYGETQTKDTDGKKFQGVLTDTGSATNEFYAVKGVNKATQNSETVADMSVAVSTASGAGAAIGATGDAAITTDTTGTQSGKLRGLVAWFARLGSLDGAAFTAGSSYVWPGLAGVYQSTVGTLTAGQQGLARLTSRRAVVTAGDKMAINLATAVLHTTNTYYTLSAAQLAGCKRLSFLIAAGATGLDQAHTINLYIDTSNTNAKIYEGIDVFPVGAYRRMHIAPNIQSATGSVAIIASVDLLENLPEGKNVTLGIVIGSGGAPTTGALTIDATLKY